MAVLRELPLDNYPTGSRTFVKQTPNGLRGFRIDIARCTSADPTIWPNVATQIDLRVVPSYDGGQSFDRTALIAMRADGGIKLNGRTGAEVVAQDFGGGFDPPANAVEVTIEVINGPIRTAVDVTVI